MPAGLGRGAISRSASESSLVRMGGGGRPPRGWWDEVGIAKRRPPAHGFGLDCDPAPPLPMKAGSHPPGECAVHLTLFTDYALRSLLYLTWHGDRPCTV